MRVPHITTGAADPKNRHVILLTVKVDGAAARRANLARFLMDPAIILFGLGVGALVGVTGMGGGSLMTPLLILVAGVQPVVAVGTDLAYAAVTKTVGGFRHFRKGTVFPRMALWLASGRARRRWSACGCSTACAKRGATTSTRSCCSPSVGRSR